jgi:hypothetical protein
VAFGDADQPRQICRYELVDAQSARVALVHDLFKAVAVLGGLLVAAGVLMILMAWGGMDERMPTQVPPRRFAGYPIAAGALLLVVAAVGLIVPGG